MLQTRKLLYDELDRRAKLAASASLNGAAISEAILNTLAELYVAAKVEKEFEDDFFETAYHSPVTGELEFFIARILYYYSVLNDKGWKVLLRRQERKTAPDIRLVKGGITFAVIEIKAKAGWIQSFFSPEQFAKDQAKFLLDDKLFDPEAGNAKSRLQLEKYLGTFDINADQVFLLLPTLALVHRKRSKMGIDDYIAYFAETSGLPKENLVLLSKNLELDLSYRLGELLPTGNFERMLLLLDKRTPIIDVEVIEKKPVGEIKSAETQRNRASSRVFMQTRFPELRKYLVRTSRRYESVERPNYLDDWWINLNHDDLLKHEFVILALALDNVNREFKVLKIPSSYLLSNLHNLSVNDVGWINLYIDFEELCDIRHEARLGFGQFALN